MKTLLGKDLTTLYQKLNGYKKAYKYSHEITHVLSGQPGGADMFDLDTAGIGFAPSFSLYDMKNLPDFQTLEGREKSFEKILSDAKLMLDLKRVRHENIIGFLETNRPSNSMIDTRDRLPSNPYANLVNVPFYKDEMTILSHQAYLNYTLQSIDAEHLYLAMPETSEELDQLFDNSLYYSQSVDFDMTMDGKSIAQNPIDFKVLYGIGPYIDKNTPRPLRDNLCYSDIQYEVASTRPIVYKKQTPHLLYGQNIRIMLAALPKKTPTPLPNFEMCMDKLYPKLFRDSYVEKFDERVDNQMKNYMPTKIDSPYEDNAIYQSAVGPYDVLALPEALIVKDFTMYGKEFAQRVHNNSQDLVTEIKQRLLIR